MLDTFSFNKNNLYSLKTNNYYCVFSKKKPLKVDIVKKINHVIKKSKSLKEYFTLQHINQIGLM